MKRRDDGFTVMDVSTDLANDAKFRRIHRQAPELVSAAFLAYTALLGASWKAGRRATMEDEWPTLIPFDQQVIDQLVAVGLVDRRGRVAAEAWRKWFEPVRARRAAARDRWSRYNANRHAEPTTLPRGSDAATTSSVPLRSAPTSPSVASAGANGHGGRKGTTNERDLATCPECGDELRTGDPGLRAGPGGQLRHETCPTSIAVATA